MSSNDSVADLTPIAALSKLESLDASFTKAKTIAPLGKLAALRTLDLRGTGALATKPDAHGLVQVAFVIDRKGKMTGHVSVFTGDESIAATSACIGEAFRGLAFPEPEGGIVRVTAAIDLELES